jgi:pyruvate formate lyase activating enzyme
MREALLYEKLEKNKVRCNLCSHRCVILEGKRGICGVRENKKGTLYSLVYGKAIAAGIDPIEKKPFFHFLPGSDSFSIATVGCNFRCKNCQNWDISQYPRLGKGEILGEDLEPKEIVERALKSNCRSVSYTYTEPTIFAEYALVTMEIAREKGLKNNWVTNGFMTKEALEMVASYLDAANVDLKSFSDKFYIKYCGARLKPVLETLKRMKKKNIWLEVTTLIIPTLNDSEKELKDIAGFIKKELGAETPWHVSQFCGEISWQLQDLPTTPVETIEKACKIGREAGLKYVYSGNIPGFYWEDTYCSKCKELMIDREGYSIIRFDKNGHCSKCGESLDILE